MLLGRMVAAPQLGLAEGENVVTIPNLFTECRTLLTELWKELVTNLLTALFAALLAG